jgi:hypothetical protein
MPLDCGLNEKKFSINLFDAQYMSYLYPPGSSFFCNSSWHRIFLFNKRYRKQAGAELCQAQFKLGLAKTAFPDVDIVFVFCYFLY